MFLKRNNRIQLGDANGKEGSKRLWTPSADLKARSKRGYAADIE